MRRLAIVLLALLVAGCSTWRPARMDERPARDRPTDIRVTHTDGSTAVLRDASIGSDSISGVLATGEPGRVALADVRSIEMRGTHPGTWLMSAMVVAGVAVGFIIADEEGDLIPAS